MECGIVICSRLGSSRLPGKVLTEINGKPLLRHLVDRLPKEMPIIVATPLNESEEYQKHFYNEVLFFEGDRLDPMVRMLKAAEHYDLKYIVRITHDKIFIDKDEIHRAYNACRKREVDYLFSSDFTDGCGFEIIHIDALRSACEQYKKVEHISYAIKAVTNNTLKYKPSMPKSEHRLLIDFPEDLDLMQTVFAILGNDCTHTEVIEFLNTNYWASLINKMPKVTFYTCVYNGAEFIYEAMDSVRRQTCFNKSEYLIIDDYSIDNTPYIASKFAAHYDNVHYHRLNQNVGLASASNEALKRAKGKYIVRLDADDFFSKTNAVDVLIHELEERCLDAIYPSNYFGRYDVVQKGNECHHIGGSLFLTRSINHIKFTDRLRNYEGLDFFGRAKNSLNIGYYNEPLFFYRQLESSMSRSNLEERARIREDIKSEFGV